MIRIMMYTIAIYNTTGKNFCIDSIDIKSEQMVLV